MKAVYIREHSPVADWRSARSRLDRSWRRAPEGWGVRNQPKRRRREDFRVSGLPA